MSRWIDIDELRRAIAAGVEELAKEAGLENPRVSVRIASAPDARGRRQLEVDVVDLHNVSPAMLADGRGKKWEDN